jgi:hypothetical protein
MKAYAAHAFLNERRFTLNFHLITSLMGSKLFVVAAGQNGTKYHLNMQTKDGNGKWYMDQSILPSLPSMKKNAQLLVHVHLKTD